MAYKLLLWDVALFI